MDFFLDTFKPEFGGVSAYACRGATHTLTMRIKPQSSLIGKNVMLEVSGEAADLGFTLSPGSDIPQQVTPEGASWNLDCTKSSKNGNFAVQLKVLEWNSRSMKLPMFLAHNKVVVTQSMGPLLNPAGKWEHGIRVNSTFTGQVASGVPVNVEISGEPSRQVFTKEDGWARIEYEQDQTAKLTVYNRYDGSSALQPKNS